MQRSMNELGFSLSPSLSLFLVLCYSIFISLAHYFPSTVISSSCSFMWGNRRREERKINRKSRKAYTAFSRRHYNIKIMHCVLCAIGKVTTIPMRAMIVSHFEWVENEKAAKAKHESKAELLKYEMHECYRCCTFNINARQPNRRRTWNSIDLSLILISRFD